MAKAARSHHCHAAFQLVVRFDRHRAARHHLGHRSLLRIEPGQQHFYGAVTLGHDTDQYVVVDGPGCRASGARLRRPCRRNEHGSRRHSSGPERFLLCSSISCRGPCPAPPRWSALEVSRNILPCQHRADVAVLTEGAIITYAPKWIGLHERSARGHGQTCLVPTFRSSCSIAASTFTNFGKSWLLTNLLILVPLYRSEVPDRIRRLWSRDFRSAVLVAASRSALPSTPETGYRGHYASQRH